MLEYVLMSQPAQSSRGKADAEAPQFRLGLVTHPVRDVEEPLNAIKDWADEHCAVLGRVPVLGGQRQLFDACDPSDCDLILAIGGDGTTLAATRAAAEAGRPVLGVACGSLGALTAVPAGDVARALDRFADGDWVARQIPALEAAAEGCEDFLAYNDFCVIRQGDGQLRISARVDGELYARFAGDGCIVSTPVGSAAYTLAAGGPLVDARLEAFALTKLPAHGGFCPPLILPPSVCLELEISEGHGGGRLEIDGRGMEEMPNKLSITLRTAAATVVAFGDEQPHLTGLRERGIITDSPRVLADDRRASGN